MSAARQRILDSVRRGLKRGPLDAAARAECEGRLAKHEAGLIPARGQLKGEALVELFATQAKTVTASVERLPSFADIPAAVARYLKANNLPAAIRAAPAPMLGQLDWSKQPLVEVTAGASDGSHRVGLSPAFAGVAETATLMMVSGPEAPTTLNFLPDHHLVVLPRSRLYGDYEAAWSRLRASYGEGGMPRAVNLVTGPSRSADIGHVPQLGAHGPRRLHILVVDDEAAPER